MKRDDKDCPTDGQRVDPMLDRDIDLSDAPAIAQEEFSDDWFEYRLEHDPRFLRRIERARESLRAGQGVKLEDIDV